MPKWCVVVECCCRFGVEYYPRGCIIMLKIGLVEMSAVIIPKTGFFTSGKK